jgi:hypothetical protein
VSLFDTMSGSAETSRGVAAPVCEEVESTSEGVSYDISEGVATVSGRKHQRWPEKGLWIVQHTGPRWDFNGIAALQLLSLLPTLDVFHCNRAATDFETRFLVLLRLPLLLNSSDVLHFLRADILLEVPVIELVGPLLFALKSVSSLDNRHQICLAPYVAAKLCSAATCSIVLLRSQSSSQ